ncbi:1-phosphofructokinase family hexose kinase [Isoptericola sp. 178]|uniref:1-phosphofructokinase family hexose kinase n=1 Tax=Isoptericola sp. 178 TaxID=3064651 RepID=UPI0027140CA0|nr:hexose kinase [Isoptericola sp. 178]MDO8145632.1 hexose kinase [Isoptericola sp. 178]
MTLTPNPAWDLTYQVDHLTIGQSVRVHARSARAGGKGVNVARVARTLGARSTAVLPLGGALGGLVADDLLEDRLPSLIVPVAGPTRQSVAMVPRDGAHPTVVNEPGPELDDAEWADLIAATVRTVGEAAPAPSHVVVAVCGSLPPGTTKDRTTDLVRSLQATGAQVYVDVSGPALGWAAEAGADLVKPNRSELAEATGTDDMVRGAAELLQHARSVVVTDGERGMHAFVAGPQGARLLAHARLPEPVVGNPTGAGDAAMAALAASGAAPWPRRLALAVATSAAAVLQPVAGAADPQHIETLLARVSTTTEK